MRSQQLGIKIREKVCQVKFHVAEFLSWPSKNSYLLLQNVQGYVTRCRSHTFIINLCLFMYFISMLEVIISLCLYETTRTNSEENQPMQLQFRALSSSDGIGKPEIWDLVFPSACKWYLPNRIKGRTQ